MVKILHLVHSMALLYNILWLLFVTKYAIISQEWKLRESRLVLQSNLSKMIFELIDRINSFEFFLLAFAFKQANLLFNLFYFQSMLLDGQTLQSLQASSIPYWFADCKFNTQSNRLADMNFSFPRRIQAFTRRWSSFERHISFIISLLWSHHLSLLYSLFLSKLLVVSR